MPPGRKSQRQTKSPYKRRETVTRPKVSDPGPNVIDVSAIAEAITAKVAANLDSQIDAAVRRQLLLQSSTPSTSSVSSTWTPQNTTGGVQDKVTPDTPGINHMGSPESGLMPASGGAMTVSFDTSNTNRAQPQELKDGSLIPGPQSFRSWATVSLDENIADKMKAKIWANEYIEFADLLKPLEAERYNVGFQFNNIGTEMCLTPRTKKTIRDFDEWSSAFGIYACVYCRKFSGAHDALAKYVEKVKEIKLDGGNWLQYDELFRRHREQVPVPFDYFMPEFYAKAFRPKSFRNTTFGNPKGQGNQKGSKTFPKGYCWRFHGGQKCTGCKFDHQCYICKSGKHPAIKCRTQGSVGNKSQTDPQIPKTYMPSKPVAITNKSNTTK